MKSISLKSKIYCGFAAMFLVLVINGWNSHRGVSLLNDQVLRAQAAGDASARILRFDRDVQELKGLVDRFVESGDAWVESEVSKLHDGLIEKLAVARQWEDPEMVDMLGQIEKHIKTHAKQFESVVNERQLREELLRSDLPKYAEKVEKTISLLLGKTDPENDGSEDRFLIAQSQALFWQAERSFLRYFDIPDGRLVADGLRSLSESRALLIQAFGEAESGDSAAALKQYEQTAHRAVQATRSYLHLRGVLMAGEASEIAYYSDRIRDRSEEKSVTIAKKIQAETARVHWVNFVALVGAAFIAAIIAVGLVLAIVPPITALTVTFNRLAEGSVVDHVSEANRNDEIGEMARAAEVFSKQNQQTRLLLKDAEKLTVELREQTAMLELTNEELDRFAYVASHDLKSPLRGIRTLAEWIEEEMGDEERSRNSQEKSKEYLRQLGSRVSKMETLLEGLLEFSRVGRMNPKSETVDLNEMIDGIIELMDNPSGVKIQSRDHLPVLTTIRTPLEQVLMNLISNAVKHHDKGKDGFVEVRCTDQGDRIEFQVIDNGPGIDKSNHQRVFQMYQRVGRTDVDGTGMGLAIVKKQVECFDGEICVESHLGKGAIFTFSWPRQLANFAAAV